MSKITRDPNSGQVIGINGSTGKVLAWLRLIQPVVLFVMGTVLIPLSVVHYKEHDRFREFMSKGERVVPQDLTVAVAGLRGELIERGALPDADRRLSALERDMDQVRATQVELKSLVVANGTNIAAILRILKD